MDKGEILRAVLDVLEEQLGPRTTAALVGFLAGAGSIALVWFTLTRARRP